MDLPNVGMTTKYNHAPAMNEKILNILKITKERTKQLIELMVHNMVVIG